MLTWSNHIWWFAEKESFFFSRYFSLIFSSKTWADDDVINRPGWYWKCSLVDIALKWNQSIPQAIVIVLMFLSTCKFISNRGNVYYKLEHLHYKLGQSYDTNHGSFFVITNWGKMYYKKLGQALQVGANFYKLG